MKCPACASLESAVIRTEDRGEHVRRTRQCSECGKRWVTVEAPREVHDVAVEIRERFRALEEACGPLPDRG